MSAIKYTTDIWLQENREYFKPPVCNRMMHDNQLKVFYVGGPNQRKDFHIEEGEELFYMVSGNMTLILLANGEFRHVPIKEGEVFLLPAKIAHSPQRKENTLGLVIERERLLPEKDCLRYFVEGTKEVLFERWFYCESLGTQLAPVIKEFFESEQFKTGKPGKGSELCTPPFEIDSLRNIEMPFSFKEWVLKYREEISENGKKRVFDESYQSDIVVYGPGDHAFTESTETFILQFEGTMTFTIKQEIVELHVGNSLLIPAGQRYLASGDKECISLYVIMNPGNKGRSMDLK